MKKAKRLLALVLGLMMLLGCVSVSAANAPLTVTEKPAKLIYENDFSGSTVDTDHITLGPSTVQSDGVLVASNIAKDTNFVEVYTEKSGVIEPVTFEFTIDNIGLSRYKDIYIRICPFGDNSGDVLGDIRWISGSPLFRIVKKRGDVSNIDITENINSVSTRVKIRVNPFNNSFALWLNGTEVLSEEASVNYVVRTSFDRVGGFYVKMCSGALEEIKLDNLKVYTEISENVPTIWEEISHEDFETDMTTAQSQGKVVLASGIDNSWKDGRITSTVDGKAWDYNLTDDEGNALTGEYVVEMRLPSPTASNNRHRVYFYENMYIGWTSLSKYDGIYVRHWNPNDSTQYQIGENNAQFNATSTLKITALINTNTRKIKIWFNDIYAYEHEFNENVMTSANSKIRFQPYGTASVEDIRVYRPLKVDENTGLKIENSGNEVKIATTAEKTGNMYFAKYNGEGNNKTLASLGIAPLNLAPGKIYTVDKTNWAGAKAFFWDKDLTPIVDPWNLAE